MIINVYQLLQQEKDRHTDQQIQILNLAKKYLDQYLIDRGYLLCDRHGSLPQDPSDPQIYILKNTPDQRPFLGFFSNLDSEVWFFNFYGIDHLEEIIRLCREVHFAFNIQTRYRQNDRDNRFQSFPGDQLFDDDDLEALRNLELEDEDDR